ncbi:hypothetical protein C477_12277 [Haloterrigena salina JCM 13891]|uniref:Uncharacterized protein n=1 Tax=Haloterrigena salina JCM 13891 TaxID=1227488 RepID=M0C6K9_9EURY|nr:hypothetical protein C477_12277 [Haloterrigena salina JCM 13891]
MATAVTRILNPQTNTAHKPCDDESVRTTACGSLVTATHDRTRIVSDETVRTSAAIERCGSCFDDVSGY